MAEEPGIQYPVLDSEGNQSIVQQPTPGSEKNFYAPNMCDKCCWYPGSPTVTDTELTDSDDHTTYESAHTYWIDLTHGRIFKEDAFLVEDPTLAVVVEVQTGGTGDWVEQTENTWGSTDDGDYSVDYEAGTVTFNAALGATDKVRASYHYAGSYIFYIEPIAGKMLKVIYAEVQYTQNIRFVKNVKFEIEAYINPANPPDRVVINGYAFKRMRNFFEESIGPYPVMPHHGGESEVVEVTGIANIQTQIDAGYDVLGTRYEGSDWIALMQGIKANGGRAMQWPLLTIPFHYNAFIPLYSVLGMRIKVTLEDDTPLGGSFGNTTFYCLTDTDPYA
jgi:hypothetical protein